MANQDLVILVPDGAYREVLPAILRRARSLGVRDLTFHVVFDPLHDSSLQAVNLLRPYQRTHSHALVLRDFEGSGKEQVCTSEELETQLEQELEATGWSTGMACAVVAAPELEDWLRLPSSHLAARLNLLARHNRADLVGSLKDLVEDTIAQRGGRTDYGKPCRPKEVFEDLLGHFGVQRSNAHYRYLAERESLKNCDSPSFRRFVGILRHWFKLGDG